jgi:hypothetical protein
VEGEAPPPPARPHTSKLASSALGGVGAFLVMLAVPLGITVISGLVGGRMETILAPVFSGPQAILFCGLGLALLGIGVWGLLTAYTHAVGEVPLGGNLLLIGVVALVAGALFLLLGMGSVMIVAAAGGGLMLAAGAVDLGSV